MFYGWVILIIGMVATIATSPGQSFLVGKFSSAIEADLGLEDTTLTAAYGIATFLAAIPLLYIGPLADRFGPRIVMGLSAAALGLSCWLIGFASGPMTLGMCYFCLRFTGQGVLGLSASHSTAMWFEKRLGTATGIKSFAMPIAILLLPPIVTQLIDHTGWRVAYGLLGAGVAAAVLPLVIIFHRNYPEEIGQHVDGVPPADGPPAIRHPHAHPDAELIAGAALEQPQPIDLVDDPPAADDEICFTRTEAMRTSAYWLVTLAMTLNALVGTAFVFLLGKLTIRAGLGPGADDQLLALFGVASAVCVPLAGILTDRLTPRWIIAPATLFLGAACACFAIASDKTLAWTAVVLLAISQALMFVSSGTFFARFFGRPHHGSIRASLTFTMVAGTSVGPFLTAWMATHIGYTGALWVFAALSLPVACAGLAVRVPQRPSESTTVHSG